MPYRYGIIITFLFFSFLSKARANEVTVVFRNDSNYNGTDDTFIKRGAGFSGGMSNFGACKMMQVNEETRIGLMRFDVSSLFKKYKKIVSIKLKLFSKNAPKQGSIHVHRLNIANSAWREGGNCGGTVIGGNRNEVTWMHLVDYGGFPAPPPSWASRTAGPTSPGVDFDKEALGAKKNSEAKIKEAFDIEFSGDLTMLIDDWSLASPIDKLKDIKSDFYILYPSVGENLDFVLSNLNNYKFIYRELDQFSWQFCNKGFFNFKGYIPKIIAKFT